MISIHVEPNATGDGSESAPCSLEDARLRAREQARGGLGAVEVLLHEGTYATDEPFTLTAADSGTDEYPITWKSAPGECAVFSAGRSLGGFRLHDEAKGIWAARVPDDAPVFEHLWSAAGTPLRRAWTGLHPKTLDRTRKGIRFTPDAGLRASGISHPEDVVMIGKRTWHYVTGHAARIEDETFIWDPDVLEAFQVAPTARGVIGMTYSLMRNQRISEVALENAYEFLDRPGEWYLDRHARTLYVIPDEPFGEHSTVTYPTRTMLLHLDGTPERPVTHITLQGLRFEYADGRRHGTTALYPAEPTVAPCPKPYDALQVDAGHHIVIDRCEFANLAEQAIHFDLAGRHNAVTRCTFNNIGGAAIAGSQTNRKLPGKGWFTEVHPDNEPLIFRDIEISDNRLRNTASSNIRLSHAICFSEFTHDLRVIHNEIDYTGGLAIRVNWKYGGYFGGHSGGIEYGWNRITRTGQAGFDDYPAIAFCCANSGSPNEVHHNYFDHCGLAHQQNAVIYLDAHTTHTRIHHNVVLNVGQPVGIAGNIWLQYTASTNNSADSNWVHADPERQRGYSAIRSLLGFYGFTPGPKRRKESTSEKPAVLDVYLPALFGFANGNWSPDRRNNKTHDNTYLDRAPYQFPAEAQHVVDNAGVRGE